MKYLFATLDVLVKEVERYTKAADQKRLALNALDRVGTARKGAA